MAFLSLSNFPAGNHLAIVHTHKSEIFGDTVEFELCYGTIDKAQKDDSFLIVDEVSPFYNPETIVESYNSSHHVEISTSQYVNEYIVIENSDIIKQLMKYNGKNLVIAYFNVNDSKIKEITLLQILKQKKKVQRATWI